MSASTHGHHPLSLFSMTAAPTVPPSKPTLDIPHAVLFPQQQGQRRRPRTEVARGFKASSGAREVWPQVHVLPGPSLGHTPSSGKPLTRKINQVPPHPLGNTSNPWQRMSGVMPPGAVQTRGQCGWDGRGRRWLRGSGEGEGCDMSPRVTCPTAESFPSPGSAFSQVGCTFRHVRGGIHFPLGPEKGCDRVQVSVFPVSNHLTQNVSPACFHTF